MDLKCIGPSFKGLHSSPSLRLHLRPSRLLLCKDANLNSVAEISAAIAWRAPHGFFRQPWSRWLQISTPRRSPKFYQIVWSLPEIKTAALDPCEKIGAKKQTNGTRSVMRLVDWAFEHSKARCPRNLQLGIGQLAETDCVWTPKVVIDGCK